MTSTPPLAARSVAIETTSGIASARACGQAITSTVIVRMTASCGLPRTLQTTAVTIADPSANQNSQPAAVSAIRCARDDEFCASVTSRWIPASAVSSPTAVTSTRKPESVATVPATTESPTPRRTGRDSPVTIDSSTSAAPSTITPSAGTLPPGRTITVSPTPSSEGATVSVMSPTTRSASSGSRAASESSAEVVCASDRISIQWPRSMITISSASSHQKSRSCGNTPRLEPHEAMKATVMARPINSIIPGARERISLIAPVKKGRPPQKYITVPSTGDTHCAPGKSGMA